MEVGGVEPENGDFGFNDNTGKTKDLPRQKSTEYTNSKEDTFIQVFRNQTIDEQFSDTEKHMIDNFRAQYEHNEIPSDLIKLIRAWSNIPDAVTKGICAA